MASPDRLRDGVGCCDPEPARSARGAERAQPALAGRPDGEAAIMERELVQRWLTAAALAAGIGLTGWLVRSLAHRALAALARRTPTQLDEELLAAARPHVAFWFVLFGIAVAVRYGNPGGNAVGIVDKVALSGFLLSLTLVVASFLTRAIGSRARQWPESLPATTLTQNAIRIAVIAVGVLVVLGNLGIAIAPVLTALGVGSLAVALALQPTLSNLFAGFHITLARQIRVGDFVELEGGQQGFVVDIGWRSTQIRELPNNLIVVPNARIAEIIVKNYSLPESMQALLVQVGVAYGSDLDEVERVTLETARDVQRSTQGADDSFEPMVRFHTFGDSSIDFTVVLRVQQFTDRAPVTHEFVKRLHRSYATAGIEIPFPQRVVHRVADR
jgi:small-conductance mechanosensitive channel